MPSLDHLIKTAPGIALQNYAHEMTPDQLDCYCQNRTRDVLRIAPGRLTPAQLALCFEKDPHAALEYAADLLTPEQIAESTKTAPAHALLYASYLLAQEDLVTAAEAACRKIRAVIGSQPDHPVVAALKPVRKQLHSKLRSALDRALQKRKTQATKSKAPEIVTINQKLAEEFAKLSHEELAKTVINDPLPALLYASNRLNPDQIVKAADQCGPQLRSILARTPCHLVTLTLAAVALRLSERTRQAVKAAFASRP